MINNYEIYKVRSKEFKFKLDFNPVTQTLDPHIWIRHTVEPIEVVVAWFNISEQVYNKTNKRYEAYSAIDNITFYYIYTDKIKSIIMIITAMKGYQL